jgi:predicted anti-sigma-YlaC factor YlaD
VNCEDVREQLPEHLLGTLEEPIDLEVRGHLRGCAGCRHEMMALAEGVSAFALAAHQIEPPQDLKDRVLRVLEQEWAEVPSVRVRVRRAPWMAWAAALVIVASLAWGAISTLRASHFEAAANKYDSLLGALGGENVRVGTLRPAGPQAFGGSAVLYDSKVGQSWALILVRAPGMQGEAAVTLSSPQGRTISMHPLQFAEGGEASSWLVTSSSLKSFDSVTIRDAATGTILATTTVG